MSNPLVTVIMLTYNRERYIEEAIASVFSQSVPVLELIILDDGSTDNTENIIKTLKNDRISYHKFLHSGKGSRLRNFGIERSLGKFITFIDSDDVWLPEKIELQLARVYGNENKPSFAFTDVIEFTNEGQILKNGIYKKIALSDRNIFALYVENKFAIYPSTILFDKRCLDLTGRFNEQFSWTDNDFFHRLAFHYDGFLIERQLVRIRKHDENTSSKEAQVTVTEMLSMLKNFFNERMIDKRVFLKMTSHYHYLSGMLYLHSGEPSLARRAFVNCGQYNPLNLKAWIRVTLTFFI